MGKKYRILFKREECIGAGPCVAVAPDFWTLNDSTDGKADIMAEKGPKTLDTGDIELIIDQADLEQNIEAAQGCPVNVIEIYDLETGEKIS